MAKDIDALADEYQRDTEKVNPGDNIGVVVFVPADPDSLYFSYWDLRKERDLQHQFTQQGFDVTLFMDSTQRLKKYDIVWRHAARNEAPLATYVFLRWQKGKYPTTGHGGPVPGLQMNIFLVCDPEYLGKLCAQLNDHYKELRHKELRERAYNGVVATAKERVVKGWALRRFVNTRWTLEKLTNPIDDPQQFKKAYPATDDPTAEGGPLPGVQRLSPERSKTATEPQASTSTQDTTKATAMAGPQPGEPEPTKTLSQMAEDEVEEFLAGVGKKLFKAPTKEGTQEPSQEPSQEPTEEPARGATSSSSSSSSDKTDSSVEELPETANDKYERLLKETEEMKKLHEKELQEQMRRSRSKSKTPASTSGKGAKASTSKAPMEEMDTREEPSDSKKESKKGYKKRPKQTPLGTGEEDIPRKVAELCRTQVCTRTNT